jgi:hypothetical protein
VCDRIRASSDVQPFDPPIAIQVIQCFQSRIAFDAKAKVSIPVGKLASLMPLKFSNIYRADEASKFRLFGYSELPRASPKMAVLGQLSHR